MCTTSPGLRAVSRPLRTGFTLVEVLVGALLTLVLFALMFPVWERLQQIAGDETEHAVAVAQTRVVVARFERDMRCASAVDTAGAECRVVLDAAPSRLVLLSRPGREAAPELIEWEIAGSSLMRRRGPWPGSVPGDFPKNLFTDHKTMLEGIAAASFFYDGTGFSGVSRVPAERAGDVRRVTLSLRLQPSGDRARLVQLRAHAGVAR